MSLPAVLEFADRGWQVVRDQGGDDLHQRVGEQAEDQPGDPDAEAPGAGTQIGILERILTLTFVLQLMVTYVPFLQGVFNTQALSLGELAQCLAFAAVVLPVVEFEKWLIRRGKLYREIAQGQ